MNAATEHIKQCVYNLEKRENIGLNEVYEKFLNFCASEVGITGAVSKVKIETNFYLHNNFDIKSIIGEDYLGEAYLELGLLKNKLAKKLIIDDNMLNKILDSIKKLDKSILIPTVFINGVGTGKILFDICRYNPNLIIYANENDRLLYKIALTNISLNKLPVKIINSLEKSSNSSPNSDEWIYSNLYNFY